MSGILARLFFRRIAGAIGLAWCAMWSLLLLFEALRGGEGGGGAALLAAVLKSPLFAMETLPFACAIGAALAMRRMVADNEMPALRAAGLSPARIVAFHVLAALPFVGGYAFLSESLLPVGAEWARAAEQQGGGGSRDVWLVEGESFVHVGRVDEGGVMLSVVIYEAQNGRLTGVRRARHAAYDGGEWRLYHVEEVAVAEGLRREEAAEEGWGLALSPDVFARLGARPREMAWREAWRVNRELRAVGQVNLELDKTIWRRALALPALPLLAALGVCFLGVGRRGRYSVSVPVLVAAGLAGVYFVARDIAIQVAVLVGGAWPLALPLVGLVGGVAWWGGWVGRR